MSALTKDNVDKLPNGKFSRRQSDSRLTPPSLAVPPGHRTPSVHKPSLSRRSSISAGHAHGQSAGPTHDVDVSQIGQPIITPRKERPSHKRSLTGMFHGLKAWIVLTFLGSYFPAQPGVSGDEEWPLGDESTWKTALKANEVDTQDPQAVANNVVRHVTTTLARQAINLDTVSKMILSVEHPC